MDTPATQEQSPAPSRKALIFVIVTVILNTMGFTLIAPVAPFLVAHYVSDPNAVGVAIGWLTSIFAICQFIAAPGLGALSDRFGRRPILMLCLLGSAVGYLFLGVGGALWVLFLGRAIDGLTGANTSILIAYITDIVPAQQRSRYFGLIGAIGAVSVVLGPAAGGLMARLGYQVPFYVAGIVYLANFCFGLLFMPESLDKAQRTAFISLSSLNPLSTLRDVLAQPQLRWLLVATFVYTLAIITIPANIGLFTKDRLNWDAADVGGLFSIFGVVTILVQGLLLQWLAKRFRGSRITIAGLVFTLSAFLLIVAVAGVGFVAFLYIGIVLFAIGDGLTSPTLLELTTQVTDASAQGKVQGASQSLQSLANMIGPLLIGTLYDHSGQTSPYIAGVMIVIVALGAILLALPAVKRVTVSVENRLDQ